MMASVFGVTCRTKTWANFGLTNLTYCEYYFPQCQTSFSILEKHFEEKVEKTERLKNAAPQDEKKPEADLVTNMKIRKCHKDIPVFGGTRA